MKKNCSLLIVDDHPIVRDAMRTYLSQVDEIECIEEASNGEEGLSLLESKQFDLIITDINMPVMNGIAFMTELKASFPDQLVLVISMIDEISQIKKMMALGACGYVMKNSPKEEILLAIEKILDGEKFLSPGVHEIIINDVSGVKPKQRLTVEIPLTKREKEVLKLIMEEFSNQQIAEKLFISIRTVEAHKRNLLEKTGSKTIAGLVLYAVERNILEK